MIKLTSLKRNLLFISTVIHLKRQATTLSLSAFFLSVAIVWNNFSTESANRLQKLQNRAARVIIKQGYEVRSHEIRRQFGSDTLEQGGKHEAFLMYKVMNESAPDCLKEMFLSTNTLQYSLRETLLLPNAKNVFKFCGALS